MNIILVIIDAESEDEEKMEEIYDNIASKCSIYQILHFYVFKKSEENIIFKFPIDQKEKCREFLK
jgi:hypothetical protein